jgi:hypothetical protein
MFMCVVNLKPVNKLDLTWKQSFLIMNFTIKFDQMMCSCLFNSYSHKFLLFSIYKEF